MKNDFEWRQYRIRYTILIISLLFFLKDVVTYKINSKLIKSDSLCTRLPQSFIVITN